VTVIDDLASLNGARLDPIAAAEQLSAILNLDSVGVRITGARVVGRGADASADLFLSDKTVVTFEKLRDIGRPNLLAIEIAACTGATPKLDGARALRAVALMRFLAEHETTFTADEIATDWGVTFLQDAPVIDVDLDDQGQRWAAFAELARHNPLSARASGETSSVAAGSPVLRHTGGVRFMRTGWFRAHVRGEDAISSGELANRMQRVGWGRRGRHGRMKATRPGFPETLVWAFYSIPVDWETNMTETGKVNE
jgi:hypothetical protein